MRDAFFTLRQFAKSPGFTFLAVVCLGLGIGVNTSIFSVLNSLFLRPLPVNEPTRLIVLSRSSGPLFSYPDFRDFRDRTTTLEGMAASFPTESSLDFDGFAHNAAAEAVSANYPQVIGVRPFLGRWFESEEEESCVISYRAWQRFFASDPNVLGKRIRSETQWYTITGVAPKEFEGIYLPMSMDLWVPLHRWTTQHPGFSARFEDRAQPTVFVFGRLKPAFTARQASAEINSIASQLPHDETKPTPILAEQVRGIPSASSRRSATPIAAVLMIIVGVILLIACVNVGNLLLARGVARRRELSVRAALGAGRGRLIRQLLTESLLLAVAGGIAGFFFGFWTNRLLETLLASGPYDSVHFSLIADQRVLIFTGLLSLSTTLLFGLAPAWRASRVDLLAGLKGEVEPTCFGLRRVSLIAQVSLSLVLLLTAGLFIRVLVEFHSADPGFAVENRLYVSAYVSAPEFTPESAKAFWTAALDRLRAAPCVKSAAITNYLPLTPLPQNCASSLSSRNGGDPIQATSSIVSQGFLNTMRVPLLAGRDFRAAEPQPVAIVNESMAKRLWPGETAIGKQIQIGCRNKSTAEVVGIARDLRFVSVGEPAKPHAYLPFARSDAGLQTIVVETASDPGPLAETVRKTILATNSAARVYGVNTLADWVDRSHWQVRWEVSVLSAFASLALLLAAVGLYGMISYHVTLRRREIGVRMAIGAASGDIFRLILRQALSTTLIGIAIGLIFSAAITRLISKLLYGVSPTDPATYAAAATLWLLIATAACYLPARRAAHLDPTESLRHE